METKTDNRGGARKGAGRKADDGATGLEIYTIKLTPEQKRYAMAQGGSAYIRRRIQQDMDEDGQ